MAEKVKTPKSLPANASLDVEQQKEFNQKVEQLKKKGKKEERGVIYVGHLPRGFYEKELRGYFAQFGNITRLRVSRSKKTGGAKGYAFVEFESKAVAQIVAETMNNYLMFNKLLKCSLMEPGKVHADTFKGCMRPFSKPKSHLLAIERHNSEKTTKQAGKSKTKFAAKAKRTISKLAEMGIDYDFPVVKLTKSSEKDDSPAPKESETEPEKEMDLEVSFKKITSAKKGKAVKQTKITKPATDDSESQPKNVNVKVSPKRSLRSNAGKVQPAKSNLKRLKGRKK